MQPVCQVLEDEEPRLAAASAAAVPRKKLRRRSLEELTFRYGQYYDSYLAADPGREAFWSRDRRGVVALVRSGRFLKAGGGLIAPKAHCERLLIELLAEAERRGELLSFYNVAESDLPLFRRHGFQVTKLGEEAVIDLDQWNCQGKPFEWLRRQVNYCRRQRLQATECRRENMAPGEWERLTAELSEVSAAFLAAKPQAAELRFLDGTFDPDRLGRRRIFVARSETGHNTQSETCHNTQSETGCGLATRAGRLEAFLVCNPYLNGDGWAFEIYRQRPDAVRGSIPFLMHQAIEALRLDDVRRVSLCLVPGLRAETALPGDSALARRALAIGGRYFNFVFDTAGLYHYKSRFRPRFEARYLCARPAVTLGSAWALVRLLGVLDIDPRKLARVVGRRLLKCGRRATLAAPP